MEAVFERKKRLLPRPTDLSFYNWDTQVSTSNATANFQVMCEHTWDSLPACWKENTRHRFTVHLVILLSVQPVLNIMVITIKIALTGNSKFCQ